MDILSIIILIFAIIIILYAFFRFIQDQNLKHIAREYEISASQCQEKIIKNPHHINIVTEKEALRIMRKRYLQLKDKFKNNSKILVEIAKDWKDYVYIIHDFLSEKEVFEIDFGDHFGDSAAIERFKKRVTPKIIKKDKIEERFFKLLGIKDITVHYLKLDSY